MEETLQTAQAPASPKKRRGKKRTWIVIVLVVLLAAGVIAVKLLARRPAAADITYQEEAVERRDITTSLTGSGLLHGDHPGFRRDSQRYL